jgi:hypothetical protein
MDAGMLLQHPVIRSQTTAEMRLPRLRLLLLSIACLKLVDCSATPRLETTAEMRLPRLRLLSLSMVSPKLVDCSATPRSETTAEMRLPRLRLLSLLLSIACPKRPELVDCSATPLPAPVVCWPWVLQHPSDHLVWMLVLHFWRLSGLVDCFAMLPVLVDCRLLDLLHLNDHLVQVLEVHPLRLNDHLVLTLVVAKCCLPGHPLLFNRLIPATAMCLPCLVGLRIENSLLMHLLRHQHLFANLRLRLFPRLSQTTPVVL